MSITKAEPKTPMCDKLAGVASERSTIIDFLEWLQSKGMELASYHKHTDACYEKHEHGDDCDHGRSPGLFGKCPAKDRICGMGEETLYPANQHFQKLAFEFLGIDEKKLEDERQAILEHIRP